MSPGQVSLPARRPPGCVFGPRCEHFRAGTCDAGPIALVVACAVMVFAALTLSNVKFGSHPHYTYGAGFMGGVFLTTIGMNGPPFAFALQGLNFAPRRMRATLQASFAIQDGPSG